MSYIQTTSELPNHVNISKAKFQKMIFITNALSNGWTIKEVNDSYIFTKKHENKREVFKSEYLESFISSNLSINDLH
jgi:hypothetical protein